MVKEDGISVAMTQKAAYALLGNCTVDQMTTEEYVYTIRRKVSKI